MTDQGRQIWALEEELETLRRKVARLESGIGTPPDRPEPAPVATDFAMPAFYWLGKLIATLLTAAFAAGILLFVRGQSLFSLQAGVTVFSLALAVAGGYFAAPGRLAAQTVFACGLGAGYVSVTALLSEHAPAALGAAALCCIGAAAFASRLRHSEAAFSVVALLAGAWVLPGFGFLGAGGPGTALVLGFSVFLIAHPRSGTFPLWAVCAAVFAQLAVPLLLTAPARPPLGELTALLAAQSLVILGGLRYSARGGPRAFNTALLILADAVACIVVVYSALPDLGGGPLALCMAAVSFLYAVLAGVAHRWRAVSGTLMACLATASMVAAAMAMWSGLPEDLFAPALACASAVLVPLQRQSGSLLLRRLETASALAAVGFCLFRLQLGGLVVLGPLSMPANWLNAFGTMFFLCVGAMLHEKCFAPIGAGHQGKALARAACAGLVLLTITVLDRGADTALPFVLGAESLGLVGLGLALFTPQIGVAGMLLLAPAHLCYHVFRMQPLPGFVTQPDFAVNTAGLAAFTLAGAAVWERYLRRFHQSTAEWDHYAVAALPFVAAAYLGCLLARDLLPALVAPAGMAALGVMLLAPSRLLRLDGLTLAGLFCLGAALTFFALGSVPFFKGVIPDGLFVPGATALAVMLVVAERLAGLLYSQGGFAPHRPADVIRLLLCAAAVLAACTGLLAAARGTVLGWGLVGVSCLFVWLGWSCRMRAYSRLGVLMLLAVPVLSLSGLQGMHPGLPALAAAGAVCALLAIWAGTAFRGAVGEDSNGGA